MENVSQNLVFSLESDEEVSWNKLIQQIIEGNVVPVIGEEILADGDSNLHEVILQQLAQQLAEKLGITNAVDSFTELAFSVGKNISLHSVINGIEPQLSRFKPSKSLADLLATKQFPFVITTSFTPMVENVMGELWGKNNIKVKVFSNNPSINDDIKDVADLSKPTVYYMFGRIGGNDDRYVLTDNNLLAFVSSWLSNGPRNLCNALKGKYLLILGNTYSDWLFRFILYSIRGTKTGEGMLVYNTLDQSLINFLERMDITYKHNTDEAVNQIVTRLSKKLKEYEASAKFKTPQDNTDVFISYSRSDVAIAEALYANLTAQGKRVWYDQRNITAGGRFMEEIHRAIRTTKYFIPILSSNIEREKNEPHVYRDEWETAIEFSKNFGRTFIIPLAEKGFDFYKAKLPERMQEHNAVTYTTEEGVDEAVSRIIKIMNED